jgi:hypothetical protein
MYVHIVVGTGSDTTSTTNRYHQQVPPTGTTNRYNKDVPKSMSFIPKAMFGVINDFAAFANLGTFTTGGGTWCGHIMDTWKHGNMAKKSWLLKKIEKKISC